MPTDFDRATAIRRTAEGTYEATIDERWNVLRGPHGGYVAAILLRALTEVTGDGSRMPRALTVYYPAAPVGGPVEISARVERAGRSMSYVTARLEQGGGVAALATAAFSAEWPAAVELDTTDRPDVPGPDDIETIDRRGLVPPFANFFHFRPTTGDRLFSGSPRALSGGWMRLKEDHELDAPLVAAIADAWPPAVMPSATGPFAAPTIELTVHFRAPLPAPGRWLLGVFESRVARDGFFEEDGVLWSEDGEVVAQSRQLALAIAPPAEG